MFALALFSPDWTPLSGHNGSNLGLGLGLGLGFQCFSVYLLRFGVCCLAIFHKTGYHLEGGLLEPDENMISRIAHPRTNESQVLWGSYQRRCSTRVKFLKFRCRMKPALT